MSAFIKIGSNYINKERITEVRQRVDDRGRSIGLRVYFGNEPTDFRGDEAAALERYILGQAFDVCAWYEALLADEQIAPES